MGRGEGEFIYAGYLFRRIGNGAYYVQSRSHPGSVYLTDSEAGECSCWPFQRNPTQPCGHLKLLAHLKSKLTQTDMNIRQKLIKNGVSNLREFGYPDVNSENILTDMIYKTFFLNMLKDNLGFHPSVDTEISQLLKELEDPT